MQGSSPPERGRAREGKWVCVNAARGTPRSPTCRPACYCRGTRRSPANCRLQGRAMMERNESGAQRGRGASNGERPHASKRHTDHLCAWSPPHPAERLGAAAICGCFAGRAPLRFGHTVVPFGHCCRSEAFCRSVTLQCCLSVCAAVRRSGHCRS